MLAQSLWPLKCFVSGVEGSTDAGSAICDYGKYIGRDAIEDERSDSIFNFDRRL